MTQYDQLSNNTQIKAVEFQIVSLLSALDAMTVCRHRHLPSDQHYEISISSNRCGTRL